jgi:hypothetical protein
VSCVLFFHVSCASALWFMHLRPNLLVGSFNHQSSCSRSILCILAGLWNRKITA